MNLNRNESHGSMININITEKLQLKTILWERTLSDCWLIYLVCLASIIFIGQTKYLFQIFSQFKSGREDAKYENLENFTTFSWFYIWCLPFVISYLSFPSVAVFWLSFIAGWTCPELTSSDSELIILCSSSLLVGGQILLTTLLFMFVCSEARRVVLRREKTHSDREHGETAMEINDNPTFIIV